MNNFDFAFTLVGLILGLSVVEVLSGLVRTLQRPDIRQLGWLTPFLGVVVICDLVTFWGMIGTFRLVMPGLYQALSAGVLVTSLYYVAAGMVFPRQDTDLNAHYFQQRRKVVGVIIACNLPVFAAQIHVWPLSAYIVNGIWLLMAILTLVANGVRMSYLALSGLLGVYLFIFIGV